MTDKPPRIEVTDPCISLTMQALIHMTIVAALDIRCLAKNGEGVGRELEPVRNEFRERSHRLEKAWHTLIGRCTKQQAMQCLQYLPGIDPEIDAEIDAETDAETDAEISLMDLMCAMHEGPMGAMHEGMRRMRGA